MSRPISFQSLFYAFNTGILALLLISWFRDKGFKASQELNINISPLILSLFLIPFLSIFGAYFMNYNRNNILLLMLLFLLSLSPFIVFTKTRKYLYPFIVYIISISLLLHKSLIKTFIWGWDIQIEYYFANSVISTSLWNPSYYHNINAMLSITMLAPSYSILSDMSIDFVFKAIYPLLFSFVPLVLYHVFRRQTDEKIAFLACFYFMSASYFYNGALYVCRQQIAELFLALLTLLLVLNEEIDKVKRSLLFTIFGASLVVSHYGISYIYMFLLIIVWLLNLVKNLTIHSSRELTFYTITATKNDLQSSDVNSEIIRPTSVLLFVIFTLTWYIYTSGSSAFDTIVRISTHIANAILTELFTPESVEGLDILTKDVTLLRRIRIILYLVSNFFITIGILYLLFVSKNKFIREYVAFSVGAFMFALAGMTVPYFTSMDAERLFHVLSLFLSPFCILGGIIFLRAISKRNKGTESSLVVLSIFLVIFLLFNSGFVNELVNEPMSLSLNSSIDVPTANQKELQGQLWLLKYGTNKPIYADYAGKWSLYKFFPEEQVQVFLSETGKLPENVYIYLRSLNVKGIMMEDKWIRRHHEYIHISIDETIFHREVLAYANIIYNNGACKIYSNS